MKAENEKYCQECGGTINIKAEICPKCGVRQPGMKAAPRKASPEEQEGKKKQERWIISLVLLVVLGLAGIHGVHRMYNGKVGTGILMLLTFGGCFIWWIIDVILLLTGKMTDPNGEPIEAKW